MIISRSGLIINTEKYLECVEFYRNTFELEIIYQEADGNFKLTCLALPSGYLMVETGGSAKSEGKLASEGAHKLRLNVHDIDQALSDLQAKGISAKVVKHSWGSTIDLHDPDGNRVSIRDEATFVDQLTG